MNKVILLGRVVKDIELKQSSGGKTFAPFTIAVDNGKGNDAIFVPCFAWEKTAENLSKYVGKGGQVLVEGRLNLTNKKVGNEYKTDCFITASTINFISSSNEQRQEFNQSPTSYSAPQQESSTSQTYPMDDDNVQW